jgi:beta-lactam-binding protein with PASTA domain
LDFECAIEERWFLTVSFGGRALSALGKVGIVLSIIVIFLFGFVGTVYLSLRTSEVKVPDISGKDRLTAETMLNDVGLSIRIRGTRPSTEKKPDTILNQLPEAGQVVKVGIPVAVEVSRAPKEGEAVSSSEEETKQEANKPEDNTNANQAAATNQNQNQNQNKPKNKNTNKNSNNANSKNANNSNKANNANNSNGARNANNANANRNANSSNRNANTTPNANRSNQNANKPNANKRPPPTAPTGANRGTP